MLSCWDSLRSPSSSARIPSRRSFSPASALRTSSASMADTLPRRLGSTPMTTKLIALWTAPEDGDGFDADYLATHAKLCSALPGVTYSTGRCVSGPYFRMASLEFESQEAMGAALGSSDGAALMGDTERLQQAFGNKADVLIVNED